MADPLVTLELLVWVADKSLAERLRQTAHGAENLLFFREEVSVINTTHLVAVLENRLQTKHQTPIAIGRLDYYDESLEKWLPLTASQQLEALPSPLKLRVWGRKKRLQCLVQPLRGSAVNFSPRSITVFVDTVEELRAELRERLPHTESDFHDILYNSHVMGWVLLEDISQLNDGSVELKLVPTDRSLLAGEQSRLDRDYSYPSSGGGTGPMDRERVLRSVQTPQFQWNGADDYDDNSFVIDHPGPRPLDHFDDTRHDSPRVSPRLHHHPLPRLLSGVGPQLPERSPPPPTQQPNVLLRSASCTPRGSDGFSIDGGDHVARLRHLVKMESARREREWTQPSPASGSVQKEKGMDMPTRITVSPLPHVTAEVQSMHSEGLTSRLSALPLQQKRPEIPDPNREECCYPGSGQLHSVDSSGHGELKRKVISYVRSLLQERAANTPIQPYLPPGGLTTQQLVNTTSLVTHHFMVKCPLRPHDNTLHPEDKSLIHSLVADALLELPIPEAPPLPPPPPQPTRASALPSGRTGGPVPTYSRNSDTRGPEVVLMRPLLNEDLSVVLYGTVTSPDPLTCKWIFTRHGVEVSADDMFSRGEAVTEPISASSFCLKLRPGALLPGAKYKVTLMASSDATGKRAQASQEFISPS